MLETRKYFDYELAYKGFLQFEKRFAKYGLKAMSDYYDVNYNEEWKYVLDNLDDYDYLTFKDMEHNATYFVEKDLDGDFYATGEVDVLSYGECDDTLFINDIHDINERLKALDNWAESHAYSEEDYKAEKKSLENILKLL